MSSSDLERRATKIFTRLGFVADREFLSQIGSWQDLIDRADGEFPGGFDALRDGLDAEGLFTESTVQIPSPNQARVGALIARDRKRMELSRPGTRKTIAALSGLDAIIRKTESQGKGDALRNVLISCPGYVIPTWTREIERFYQDPEVVVVTRRNRRSALDRLDSDRDKFIIVSHTMSYQNARNAEVSPGQALAALSRFRGNKSKVLEELEPLVSDRSMRRLEGMSYRGLIEEYIRRKALHDSDRVLEAIRQKAFDPSHTDRELIRYMIIDEFHNIVNPMSQTARAHERAFRESEFGALLSGTGIANEFGNLSYAAYLMGIVEDPREFRSLVGNDPRKVKAVFDLTTIRPTLRLEDVDPHVPPPRYEVMPYQPSGDQWKLYLGLLDHGFFDTKQLYQVLSYALSSPARLLPENIAGDEDDDDSLFTRISSFFDQNPELLQAVHSLSGGGAKVDSVREMVRRAESEGKKCLIACEYTEGVTSLLEERLKDFGAVRIDQSVSAEPGEIRLTAQEISSLESKGLYRGESLRSELPKTSAEFLGIAQHERFLLSDREKAVLDFVTSDASVLIAGYRSLREGVDCQEASVVIPYDITTVPSWFAQFMGRAYRSGQKRQVEVWFPVAPNTLDEGRYRRLMSKLHRNEQAEFGEDMTFDELERWKEGDSPYDDPMIAPLLAMTQRSMLGLLFESQCGQGENSWAEAMTRYGNARFFAQMYNYDYETTYSANTNRCIAEIVEALQRRDGVLLRKVLDAGGGPAAMSRALGRETTVVDMVRYQMEFGIQACADQGIRGSRFLLGTVTDLSDLIELDQTSTNHHLPEVFDPGASYEGTKGLEQGSYDLVTAGLLVDLLSEGDRARFFQQAHRVLKGPEEGGSYLIITEPVGKFDESCRAGFYEDLYRQGFQVDVGLTGTYLARDMMELSETSGSPVEVEVIVARKFGDSYEVSPGTFLMREEYRLKQGPADAERESDRREAVRPRLLCSDFYNRDTGVGLDSAPAFAGYQPASAAPKKDDADIEKDLLDQLSGIDDIDGVCKAIEELF